MRRGGEFYDYGEAIAVHTNSPCMASVYYGNISSQGPRYLLGRSGDLVVNICIRRQLTQFPPFFSRWLTN